MTVLETQQGSEESTAPSEPTSPRKSAILLVLRHYFGELKRQWRVATPALTLPALGNVCLYYLAPLAVAGLVGHLAAGGDGALGALLPYVLGFGGLLLLGEVFWRVGLHFLNRTDARGIERLGVVGMDELLVKDAAFFHDNFAGSLTKRVLGFSSRFEDFVDTMTFSIMAKLVPLAFASVVLWNYDPLLVIVLLGLIVVTGFLVAPLIRRRQAMVDEREAAKVRVSGHVADVLSNMDTVRAFAAEDREASEHRARIAEQTRLSLRSWDYGNLRVDTVVAPMSVLTSAVGLLLAVALRGGLGVEAIVVTFTYYTNTISIMFEFNQIYRRLESVLTEAAQFTELLLDPPTVVDPADPQPLRPADASVRFERVRFAYNDGPPLFDRLDLDIASGTRIGLVGQSGGGKSTLTRLLLRLMDIDGGRILIGGQDISRLRQADLRSLIAYVPQEPAMFHRSIRDNIAFARPDATEAEIIEAARAAHVTEFADSLPDGFGTLVGERGVKLSGGQRQRIALARAILRDAPILLLDEATSALDSESEILVQEALWRLMQGRTALVVAHRLSTVVRMDRLVVLNKGRIVEQGTHSELLQAQGPYARLWRHQSGGFLIDDDQEDDAPAAARDTMADR
ncbi:Transport ATP-binding protein CydCD [[Actinomadura] parvosata subsp. kistnae]|uniref:Fatty acid ABC transporter ATP-binding/permease protein n=1 Tax=[Actinomadura] parvosata subsp. kistnae TaxID=1909395 RepID=A0A1V0AHD6_9ACTN|nr:ABC transporter ATP-binding protein [Nonomuraea sp. ATCC 55076]AQZ69599.1 ABC transporter ATP-binding protein [Nonomuraea sp. ATCC 55076]SPL91706.1 Transport ATP-binding protein CydCD [Actinomadura parvosata subsp. kistnae]